MTEEGLLTLYSDLKTNAERWKTLGVFKWEGIQAPCPLRNARIEKRLTERDHPVLLGVYRAVYT